MAQVGRISGPLLQANLERNGKDLAFRNDLSTTQLLYLDVNTGKIGVNTATPAFDLEVVDTIQTTNLIGDFANIAGYTIEDSTLSTIGNLNLDAGEAIVFSTFDNGTIRINDNIISTTISNADIDITPNGTGTVRIGNGFLNDDSTVDTKPDLEVFGNIYTPGNITFEGTITLGDQDTDDVTFYSDISSDIIPDANQTYNIGSEEKQWLSLYTYLLNGELVGTTQYFLDGVDLATRHGGTIYVAQEGNDDNKGDHILDPMATIKGALAKAEASGDQPFIIKVSAGDYQEELPLVVPPNVSIVGSDIRNTVILPDTNSQDKDVFHLSDSCQIQDLTIKDFYYNSTNNTGYAFRFAPNTVMNNRSPYIQNVTVITQETNPGDGDAGRGAWIDGAELNAASPRATMLFHSCTFISPGADVINMTNGVRVEWLNSFTYFANRGLYAFNGATGRTSEDGSTVIYGAELRSIGSANVYGTYGAVADGADTLMYLIQHNFAYIGAGSDRTNDLDLVVQANEVVELNSGQIHYVSTDQVGNFRVGDNFFVNFETGQTSINIDTAEIEAISGLDIVTPEGTTTITGEDISVGNIIIDNNVITTKINNLILKGATNTINVSNSTSISGNLDIRDNFSFGGTLNIAGDQPGRDTVADKLVFNVEFQQDFKPHQDNVHSLGELQRFWRNAWLNRLELPDIVIDENYITTTTSNSDLELRANGTGKIIANTNDVEVTNNLTVNGLTNLKSTNFQGLFDSSGTFNQTGNRTATNFFVSQDVDISRSVQLEEILIDDNYITTTTSNTNLEIRAAQLGDILILNNNLRAKESVIVPDIINNSSVYVSDTTEFTRASVDDFDIEGNLIKTTTSNADIELRANGTGRVVVQSGMNVDTALTVNSTTRFEDGTTVYTYGPELVLNGTFDTNLDNWQQAGGGTASEVNGNLQINATGVARNVSQEITVEPGKKYIFEAQFRSVSNSNPFYLRIFESGIGTLFEWNENTGLTTDEVLIFEFTAQTTAIDIIFRAVDTIVEWDNVSMFEDIGNVTTFQPVEVNYTDLTIVGDIDQNGNYNLTGDLTTPGNLTVSNEFTKSNININDNIIRNTGEGLRMSNNSTDASSVPEVINYILGGGSSTTSSVNLSSTLITFDDDIITFDTDALPQDRLNLINFFIDNNYVDINQSGSETTSDYIAYLQYVANGSSGTASIDERISTIFDEIIQIEIATPGYFPSVIFEGDYFNPNLELRAANLGKIILPNNDARFEQDLLVTNITTSQLQGISENIESSNYIVADTTELKNNFIQTFVSNADLELRAFDGKNVFVPQNDVVIEQDLTVNGNVNLKSTDILGDIVLTGDRNQSGNLNVIGNVTVSTSNIQSEIQFDDILFNDNVIESQDSNADLELISNGTGIISILDNDFKVANNVTAGTITSSDIVINSDFAFDDINLSSNIKLFDNVITTTESNSNLELRTIDDSSIRLKDLYVSADSISTTVEDIDINTDQLTVNSNAAINLAIGTTQERSLIGGSIRFNTSTGLFESVNNSGNIISFGGVFSSNTNTSVLATDTSIDFTNVNTLTGSVDSDGLSIHGLEIDDISLQNNTIRTNVSNSNLDLVANGSGNLILDDVTLSSNVIQNNSNGSLTIRSTLYGRSKFIGSAVVIPSGTNAEQPVAPEVGTTRWNTETEILEVWDGNTFVTTAGTLATVTAEEMDDLLLEYTLIFG